MPVARETSEVSPARLRREAAARRRAEAQRRKEARDRARNVAALERERGAEFDAPRSTGGITPKESKRYGAEERKAEAQRRKEDRARAAALRELRQIERRVDRDLSRSEMPGASLRTKEARRFREEIAAGSEGLLGDLAQTFRDVPGVVEGGVDLLTGIPSFVRDPSLANAGWVAANVTPLGVISRPAKVGMAAARAARAGDDVGEITRASIRNRGRGSRYVRLGDSSIQFYSSPSVVTRFGQRLIDDASERLTGTVNTLRGSESKIAQKTGAALTPLSARGRVPKRAATLQRREQGRARAARNGEIDLVKGVGGRRLRSDSPAAEAFFWEAQLPSNARGPEGIQRIIDDLNNELGALTPERIAANPQLPVDLRNQITKLEKAKPFAGKYDERALDSARTLMDDRADILIRAGRLDPENAAGRTSLLTRRLAQDPVMGEVPPWVRVEPTDEIYVGHREGDVRGGRRMGPGGMSTSGTIGKTRAPQGTTGQNTLGLYRQGRLRTDPDVIVEDWQAAQAYEFNNMAKDELASMGSPIDPGTGVLPDHIIVNPQGHQIPRRWRQNEDDLAGPLTGEELVGDLDEYITNYMPGVKKTEAGYTLDPAAVRNALDEMAAGNPLYQDIRQVPLDVVSRFYARLVDPKVVLTHPFMKAPAVAGKIADAANDVLYMSLIYSNPGYIPANLAGNLALNVLHEGAFAPFNLLRAGHLLAKGPKPLRRMILNEVGQGPTTAVASSFLKKPAGIVARVPDDAPRVAAFLHEAAKAKVISKVNVKLSQKDLQKLEGLFAPQNRAMLNDIKDAAEEAMVRFDRMSPSERAFARRLLFVWPWIRGATAYPFRFAMDYPLRTAAIGGAAGYYVNQEGSPFVEDMPPWLSQAVKVGEETVNGETFPSVFNTGPLSPVSTAYESISSLLSRPGSRTAFEFLNPGIRSALYASKKESSYGRDVGSYSAAFRQNVERLAPNLGLTKDLISPPEDGGIYPEDVTRTGRLKRAARVLPYAIDPEEARDAAVREGVVEDNTPPDPPKYAKIYQWATVEGNLPNATPEARADIDLWKRGQDLYNYGRVTIARQTGLENKDGSPSVGRVEANRRIQYALRAGVLEMIRPGYLRDDWRAYHKKVYSSKDKDAIEQWEDGIRAALSFTDKYGRSLQGQLEELMEAPVG